MSQVTPHVGVWIETYYVYCYCKGSDVTPHVGVWIETARSVEHNLKRESLPMWECGLKHDSKC